MKQVKNGSLWVFSGTLGGSKKLNKFLKHACAIYESEPCGGLMHIVLDDDNVDDSSLAFCRQCIDETQEASHIKLKEHYYECLDVLASVSERTRLKYVYNLTDVLYEQRILEHEERPPVYVEINMRNLTNQELINYLVDEVQRLTKK